MKSDDLQKNFFESLLKEDQSLCPKIKENSIATKERRWGVYSYAYRIRIIEVIEQDFELLEKELGKESLRSWIREALSQEPSKHFSISQTPDLFLNYLKKNRDKKYYDMACYEVIRERLFDYEKVESHLLENLSKYTEDEIIYLVPQVNPSIQVYESHWENLNQGEPNYHTERSYDYLLYSFEDSVKELAISKKEKALLEEMKKAKNLKELAKIADESLLDTIFGWAKRGILINVLQEDK